MILLACSSAVPSYGGFGAVAFTKDVASDMDSSVNHLLDAQSSSISENTASSIRISDARDERALPVAVPLVAVGAGVLCLRVHDLVDEGLGHDPDELLDVDHAVVESGNLGHDGRAVP